MARAKGGMGVQFFPILALNYVTIHLESLFSGFLDIYVGSNVAETICGMTCELVPMTPHGDQLY